MYVVQISDRDAFADRANAEQRPVTVVRTAGVVPVERAGGLVMHPALTMDYSLEFDDPRMGETRWTFREVVLTGEQGEMLTDSLWARLVAQGRPNAVQLSHRSGSF